MVNLIALVFALILSIAHHASEDFHVHKNKYKIMSFGAGIMLSYLILDLLPSLYVSVAFFNNIFFLFVLLGFIVLHLIEKHVYQHASKVKRLRELKEAHSIAFFIYYTVIGIVLANITAQNTLKGLLLLIPLVFHTTLGALSINELHHEVKEKKSIRLLLSSSPVIGVLIFSYVRIPAAVNHSLLSFVAGVLLFIITREIIPKESKGDQYNFMMGVLVYALIIVSTWLI